MLRAILFVVLPLASTLWLRSAHACSCGPESVVVHPPGATIPANDGLIGRLVFVTTPTISVSYADDPLGAPIPGTFQSLLGGPTRLWTFVPVAPFAVGRTVRAVVRDSGGIAPMVSRDFLVSSSTTAAAPDYTGITGMQAIVSRFRNQAGGSCAPGPEQSRVVLEGLPRPSARAPLYRYFYYRQGTPPPAEPTAYGVADHFVSTVRCGNPSLRCEPDLPLRLRPGEVWCARVEATDLAGRGWGYDSEACATVVAEDVDLIEFGGMVSCVPVAAPDAGVALDSGTPDAGTTAPDAGTTGADGGDGCTCVRPREGAAHASAASLLLVAWALFRRRRARA